MSTHDTAARARAAVARAVQDRGGRAREVRVGRRTELLVETPDGGSSRSVRVLSKRRGDWQTSTNEADDAAQPDPARCWVFVDLAPPGPQFYVAPEHWVRRDIAEDHHAYLQRHGGRRALSPDSEHHRVQPSRVSEWHDRWDLLGLPPGD